MMGGQQFSLSVLHVYTVQMYSELMCVGPGGLMQASLEKARPVLHTSLVHSTRVHFNML